MVTDNLLEFLNDFQKFALKIKIQQILDTMVKDDRVHEVIDADKVFDYYNKMHEEFVKNPHNFLFPNREWLQDSLKRLNVDVSEIFNEDANQYNLSVYHLNKALLKLKEKLNEGR